MSPLPNSSKSEVIRQALHEKKERLAVARAIARRQRLLSFLKNRVWPHLPEGASQPWSKEEEERALGFGEHGEPV